MVPVNGHSWAGIFENTRHPFRFELGANLALVLANGDRERVNYIGRVRGLEVLPRTILEAETPQAVQELLAGKRDSASEAEDEVNEMYNDYRKSAYEEADIDTIRVIRELAETGRLDALPS